MGLIVYRSRRNLDPGLWAGWDGWVGGLADDPMMSHSCTKLRGEYMPELAHYVDEILTGSPSP